MDDVRSPPSLTLRLREMAMSIPMTSKQVLDREYLEIRGRILEIAAAFDRLDRAEGEVSSDPRVVLLRESLTAISNGSGDRAEQVQLIFSRRYEPSWREKFGLTTIRQAK